MKRRAVLKYAASAPVLLSLPTIPLLSAPRAQAESPVAGRIVFLDPGHRSSFRARVILELYRPMGEIWRNHYLPALPNWLFVITNRRSKFVEKPMSLCSAWDRRVALTHVHQVRANAVTNFK